VKYAYYPGCSAEASGAAYDISLKKVADKLHFHLGEIDDWNCCGASEYTTLDRLVAQSVVARNLARVDKDTKEVVAACSACYLNLRKTDVVMAEHGDICARVNEALGAAGLSYEPGHLRVRHLLDVVFEDFGEAPIRERVTKPLKGLRVAPYYGCLVTRPIDNGDDPEYPTRLDELLRWLGATVVDYPVKTHCCGGHMTQISEPQAHELIRRLLRSADQYDADVIACMCPMCQLNLDAYQSQVNARFNTSFSMPIVYFTQLMGLAFGMPYGDLGFGREIVPARGPIEAKLGNGAEEADDKKKPARRKKDSPELPMPQMDD
jgi:heterodisulfide reductase subunit B